VALAADVPWKTSDHTSRVKLELETPLIETTTLVPSVLDGMRSVLTEPVDSLRNSKSNGPGCEDVVDA
jgi:hypothetical protein